MTLDTFYNLSIGQLINGSIGQATVSTFESAFVTPGLFWFIVFIFVLVLVFIRTLNLGLVGVIGGVLSEGLFTLGKFPIHFHIFAYTIIAFCIGLTIFLFYTDKYNG